MSDDERTTKSDEILALIQTLMGMVWHPDVFLTLEPLIGSDRAAASVLSMTSGGGAITMSNFSFREPEIEAHWEAVRGELSEIVFIPHDIDLKDPSVAPAMFADLGARLTAAYGQPIESTSDGVVWANGERLVRLKLHDSHREAAALMVSIEFPR
ncbi:MAG: hypothetical protein QOK08_2197 [Actinomycetota bacterium]|nr:hypothetical protein [Actinomycetota bacterium]